MDNSTTEEQPTRPSGRHWTAPLTLACTGLFLVLLVVLGIPLPYPPEASTIWLYEARSLNLFVVVLFPLPLCLLSGIALYKVRLPQWRSGVSLALAGLIVGVVGILLDVVMLVPLIQLTGAFD